MVQKPTDSDHFAELVLITDVVREADFRNALTDFNEMEMIQEISSQIRVYG
jgi:hypothetical protein